MKLFNKFEITCKPIMAIHDWREDREDKVVAIMDTIGKNEAWIKMKNEGADELVALGIQAGIAMAEGQSGQDITIPQESIDKIADKGGDKLVGVFDKIVGAFKKLLKRR